MPSAFQAQMRYQSSQNVALCGEDFTDLYANV